MLSPHFGTSHLHRFAKALPLRLPVIGIMVATVCLYAFGQTSNQLQPNLPFSPKESIEKLGQENSQALTINSPVRQKLAGGEEHAYRVALTEGQYLHVVVKQLGVDVTVKIVTPAGLTLIEKDSPNGAHASESISVIVSSTGDFIINVSCGKSSPSGEYEITVQELQTPTPENSARAKAEMAFAAGQALRTEGTKKSRAEAIDKYNEALSLWRHSKDIYEEAYTLCSLGVTYKDLSKLEEASKYLTAASLLLRDAGDGAGYADMLNAIGAAYRLLGNPLTALDYYNQALALRRSIGDRSGEAQLLNNIGLVYARMSNFHKALENYKLALALWQVVHDRSNEANTLNNIAGALDILGESTQALETYKQQLSVARELGNKRLEAFLRNNIGLIYDTRADTQSALEEYEHALALFRELKNNRDGEAMVLDNIAMLHVGLGDTTKAFESLNKSLVIREQLNQPRESANTLNGFGYAYGMQGSHQEALHYFELALPFARQSKDQRLVAYALANAGMSYTSIGEPQKALEYLTQSLEIMKKIGDLRGQAIVLDKLGQASSLAGDSVRALAYFDQSLAQWAAVKDKQGQASTLYAIAVAESGRNNLSAARDKIDEAISIVESLRTNMSSRQLRLDYLSGKHDYYGLCIDIRMRLYQLNGSQEDVAAALYASERSRARSLLDLLTEAQADVRLGVDPDLVDEERRLEQEIKSHSESLIRLRIKKHAEDAAVVEEKLNALIDQHDRLETRIRSTSQAYAGLKQPNSSTLKEIQAQFLDDNTLLLEYALGDKVSYLFEIGRTSIKSYVLPKRTEIEKAALELRELLTAFEPARPGEDSTKYVERVNNSQTQYSLRAAEFSRIVFGGAASQFGSKRLIIVPDGALHFIPFEALPVTNATRAGVTSTARKRLKIGEANQQLLVQSNEITYLPSATALSLIRNYPRKPTNKTLAVLADPVFNANDERIPFASRKVQPQTTEQMASSKLVRALRDFDLESGDGLGLERLPNTLAEADKAMSMIPAGSGMLASSFEANRATAKSDELGKYRIVHFATHGLLDDKHPELSGIVLSMVNEKGQAQDGFLQLQDIYDLRLPVDLVVLSACRTGIGKQIRGEGLIGLSRGFMYAGAARIVASLWKVDDEATAALMERFYWHLIKQKVSPSAALKAAKLDIMKSRVAWRAPYYWAGFVLQGDWK